MRSGSSAEVLAACLFTALLFSLGIGLTACVKDFMGSAIRDPRVAPYIQPFAPGSGYITVTGLTEMHTWPTSQINLKARP